MGFNSIDGNEQFFRHLLISASVKYQPEDIQLTGGQRFLQALVDGLKVPGGRMFLVKIVDRDFQAGE